MVITLSAQVLATSSYLNAKEVSYYRVDGSDPSLLGANYSLVDFRNAYCVRTTEAAFADPRAPLSGGTAGFEWGFPGANQWVEHHTYSTDFDTWTKSGSPTVTGSQTDPFGGNSASILGDDNAAGFEAVLKDATPMLRLNQVVRVTVYVGKEADIGSFPEIQVRDTANAQTYYVDINKNTGATAIRTNTGWTTASHSLTSYNNEWWKYQVTLISSLSNSLRVSLLPAVSDTLGTTNSAATGSAKFFLDTIETDNAYKDVNQMRLFSDGGVFIESERTNINSYSQDLEGADWSDIFTPTLNSDSTLGPDGNLADSITTDADREGRRKQNVSASAGVNYSYSAYAKLISGSGEVQLERSVGLGVQTYTHTITSDGWERFGSTWSGTTSSFNYGCQQDGTGTKTVAWSCVQMEQGEYPTSIIRTVPTGITRNADYVRVPSNRLDPEFLSGHFKVRFVPTFDSTAQTAGGTTKYIFGFDGISGQNMRFRSTGAQWQIYCINDTGQMTFIVSVTLGGGGFDIWRAGDLIELEANHRTGEYTFRNISKGTSQTDTDVAAAGGSFSTTEDLIIGGGNGAVNFFDGVILPPEAVY